MSLITRFLKDTSGATAIEYGLIAGLVFLAASASFVEYGRSLGSLFAYISTSFSANVGN